MSARLSLPLDSETHRSPLEQAERRSHELPPVPTDPRRIFNLGRSSGSDVARDQAAMLGEGVASFERVG
jgi:hypothetical protein